MIEERKDPSGRKALSQKAADRGNNQTCLRETISVGMVDSCSLVDNSLLRTELSEIAIDVIDLCVMSRGSFRVKCGSGTYNNPKACNVLKIVS